MAFTHTGKARAGRAHPPGEGGRGERPGCRSNAARIGGPGRRRPHV